MSRRRLVIVAIVSLAGSLLLAAGALVAVTVHRPIYYVGTRGESGVVEPGRVPKGSLRQLALVYLSTFETYTPVTISENDKALKAFVSPRHFESFGKILDGRRDVVGHGGVTSVFVPDHTSVQSTRLEDGRYEVKMRGMRKTYLADQLDRHAQVEYLLYFEVAAPTLTNPSGLYVVGQRFREIRQEDKRRE